MTGDPLFLVTPSDSHRGSTLRWIGFGALGIAYAVACGIIVGPWFAALLVGIPVVIVGLIMLALRSGSRPRRRIQAALTVLVGLALMGGGIGLDVVAKANARSDKQLAEPIATVASPSPRPTPSATRSSVTPTPSATPSPTPSVTPSPTPSASQIPSVDVVAPDFDPAGTIVDANTREPIQGPPAEIPEANPAPMPPPAPPRPRKDTERDHTTQPDTAPEPPAPEPPAPKPPAPPTPPPSTTSSTPQDSPDLTPPHGGTNSLAPASADSSMSQA